MLNCFITLAGEQVAAARQAEEAVRDGTLGLHTASLRRQDLVNTAGVRTTFGSLRNENVPREDAVCAARMKAADAILFGKTTTPGSATRR